MRVQRVLLCAALALATFGCDDDGSDDTGQHVAPLGDGGTEPSDGGDDGASCGVVGRSVACVGPGGCAGGQVCRADGSFGQCECEATVPAPRPCSPDGTLAVCVGRGACSGLQVCGDDGRFGPCQCPEKPDDPAGTVTGLEITSPAAGASVAGAFTITGSAEGHVSAVHVSIGGGPLLLAEGTEQWSLRFDPTGLPPGPMTIVALATGEDGGELQRWIQVQNTDPLVGTWLRKHWNWYPNRFYCALTLEANGAVGAHACDSSGVIGYDTWRRLHGDVVGFGNSWGRFDYAVLATLSADGETLVLKSGTAYNPSIETFERVHGDLPPRPDDYDGGIDDDAGS